MRISDWSSDVCSSDLLQDWTETADVVLVDAPCSGTGTWRRNPEARWRLTPERLDRLATLQAHLLEVACPLVKSGGALVYVVCSLLDEEGAGQIAAFLGSRSEEHTSELQSLMRISYAVFCLKKK